MPAVLRPLRLGELLDRAVRLYRQNFLQFVGIVAFVQVPITVVQLVVSLTTFGDAFGRLGAALNNPAAAPENPFSVFGPAYFVGASLNSAIGILGFILLQGVATAALTAAVAGAYFGDGPDSILDAYRRIREKWITVVGALLLAVVLAIALMIWWLVPCFGWLTGGGMLLFLWYIIVPLLAPIIILEDGSPTDAWRRAWVLARRRFWWVLGFAVVLYVFNLLVVAGPATVVSAAGQFLGGDLFELSRERFTVQTIAQAITVLITRLFYLPLQVAGMTLLYLDLRVRTEGADLALAANAAATNAVAAEPAGARLQFAGLPASGAQEPLMVRKDWLNFALLTVAVVSIFILLYAAVVLVTVGILTAMGSI